MVNTLCATGSISRSVTKSSYIEPFHNILIVKSIQTQSHVYFTSNCWNFDIVYTFLTVNNH